MPTICRSQFMLAVVLGFLISVRALEMPAVAADEPVAKSSQAVFPIAVWLQDPKNATRYKAVGINTYVGLWRGPSDAQIDALKAAGMKVICSQNEAGLKRKDDPIIIGWMHGDEPDNAQSKRGGEKGYDPPILPERIVEGYKRMKERDPSRPVFLNLGQGVAWDDYIGRGVRRRHPEDYPEYVKGADIASFDIYPAVHDAPAVAGNLWYVAHGVSRLKEWSGPQKQVWNCIEASRISNEKTKPTPAQIKAEVWMSIVHGSRGLVYFVHQFKPRFVEASLLEDDELLRAVTAINAQVQELAPVILSAPTDRSAEVSSSNAEVPVAVMTRRHDNSIYIFAVAMRGGETTATVKLPGITSGMAEVLGETRTIPVAGEAFADKFAGYGVHLYRVR